MADQGFFYGGFYFASNYPKVLIMGKKILFPYYYYIILHFEGQKFNNLEYARVSGACTKN